MHPSFQCIPARYQLTSLLGAKWEKFGHSIYLEFDTNQRASSHQIIGRLEHKAPERQLAKYDVSLTNERCTIPIVIITRTRASRLCNLSL